MKPKKYALCPRCRYLLITRRSIKIKKPKSYFCSNCGYEIKNPHEVFQITKIEIKGDMGKWDI